MKQKLLFSYLVSILFTATSFAHILVKGDVLNKGDVQVGTTAVPANLEIAAVHNGNTTTPSTLGTGIVENNATAGKRLDVKGTLVLNSVAWALDNANQANGSDGIFLSNPTATDVPTSVNSAKVVKYLRSNGYYLISLPFDVPAGGITQRRTGISAKYVPWNVSAGGVPAYWILYYDTKKRAIAGLLGEDSQHTGEVNTSTGWVGFGDASEDSRWKLPNGTDDEQKKNGFIRGTSPELKAGQLYQFYVNASGWYTFTAKTEDNHLADLFGTVASDFDRTKTGLLYTTGTFPAHQQDRKNFNSGWHAIGAMQTAPFHVNASATESNIKDVTNCIYVYDYTQAKNQLNKGKWVAVNISGVDNDENVSIAPYAGMMVQIADPGGEDHTTALSFAATGRKTTEAGGHFRSNVSPAIPFLRLQLYNTADDNLANKDLLRVILKQGSSNDFKGGEDGLKFFGGNAPEFGTIVTNAASTVIVTNDYRTSFADKEEIPVSLWIKESGNYTIKFTMVREFDKPIYLVDKNTETLTELIEGQVYEFQASATEKPIDSRFALRAGGTTELPASVFNKIIVYTTDNQVYIKNVTEGDRVEIYNIAGQLVETLRVTSSDISVALPGKGVYVVKVTGSESVVTKIMNK
jgi:hypothetical protein